MWKQLLDFGKRLASLVQKTQQHEEDIKKLQQHEVKQDERIDKLAEAVQQRGVTHSEAIFPDRDRVCHSGV